MCGLPWHVGDTKGYFRCSLFVLLLLTVLLVVNTCVFLKPLFMINLNSELNDLLQVMEDIVNQMLDYKDAWPFYLNVNKKDVSTLQNLSFITMMSWRFIIQQYFTISFFQTQFDTSAADDMKCEQLFVLPQCF